MGWASLCFGLPTSEQTCCTFKQRPHGPSPATGDTICRDGLPYCSSAQQSTATRPMHTSPEALEWRDEVQNGHVSLKEMSATRKAMYICRGGREGKSLLQPELASWLTAVLNCMLMADSLDRMVASIVPQCQLLRAGNPSAVPCTSCAWTDRLLSQIQSLHGSAKPVV